MLRIIMISGYKRSGKDFISNKLNELILGSTVVSFATPLKDIVATTMSLSNTQLEEHKNNEDKLYTDNYECITTFRSILQRFGTEAMQKWFGKTVWVDLLINNLPEDGVVIISDWRFKAEYTALSKIAHVTTVRVRDINITGDGHISEHDLDDFVFDAYIDNSSKDESVMYPIKTLVNSL